MSNAGNNPNQPDRASEALRFAAKSGSLLLGSTAPAMEAVDAMLDIAAEAGLDHVDADITYSQITLTHRPPGAPSFVHLQNIHGRIFNYGRYTRTENLIEEYVGGSMTLERAETEADNIASIPGPYPWWLTRLAAGTAGITTAVIFGADWITAAFAFIANVAIDWMYGFLGRRGWPVFYLQIFTGIIAVAVAAAVRLISPGTDPSQVIVAVIILMLAGMTSTGGVLDLITGWYLTGVGRLAEGAVNTVGLIVGIVLGIQAAAVIGLTVNVSTMLSFAADPLWMTTIVCAVVACSFSLYAQVPLRAFLPAAALTSFGWLIFSAATAWQVNAVWSAGIAALIAGLLSAPLGVWMRVPATVLASITVIPLFPGITLYRALLAGTEGHFAEAAPLLLSAAGTALLLAAGITLGQFLMVNALRDLRGVRSRFVPEFLGPFTDLRGRRDRGSSGKTS